MAGLVTDAGAFEYSNTFRRLEAKKGAVGAAQEIVASTVPNGESFAMKCPGITDGLWDSFIEFTSVDDTVIGFYVKFDGVLPPLAGGPIFFMHFIEPSGPTPIIRLKLDQVDASNHELAVIDRDGNEIASTSNPFTANFYRLLELRFRQEDSAPVDVWLDESSVISSSGEDFNDIGEDIRLRFTGQSGKLLIRTNSTFISSFYLKTGGSNGTDHFVGPFMTIPFQVDKSGATPDSGDPLDGGAWPDTSDGSASNVAKYFNNMRGFCVTNDAPGNGPGGKISPSADMIAAKWSFWCHAPIAPNLFDVIWGKSDGSIHITTTTETTFVRGNNPYNIVQDKRIPANNRVPEIDQFFVLGFGNDATPNGTVSCFLKEAFGFGLFKLPLPPNGPVTVHLRGGHFRGGEIAGK